MASWQTEAGVEWLRSYIDGVVVLAAEGRDDTEAAGHSARSIEIAKKRGIIRSFKDGFGPDGEWYWVDGELSMIEIREAVARMRS